MVKPNKNKEKKSIFFKGMSTSESEFHDFSWESAFEGFWNWLDYLFEMFRDPAEAERKGRAYGFIKPETNSPYKGLKPGDRYQNALTGEYGTMPGAEKKIAKSNKPAPSTTRSTVKSPSNITYSGNANSVILDFIYEKETGKTGAAAYEVMSGGDGVLEGATNKSIAWVLEKKEGAVGGPQFTNGKDKTLEEAAKAVLGNDYLAHTFDAETQDAMCMYLLNKYCKFQEFLDGKVPAETVVNLMANRWAIFKTTKDHPKHKGRGVYDGYNGNSAKVDASDTIKKLNEAKAAYDAAVIFKAPFDQRITSHWGHRHDPITHKAGDFHEGTDYSTGGKNTPIYANHAGRVVYNKESSGYGRTLIVEYKLENNSGKKVYGLYGHLSNSEVLNYGDTFKADDKIAISGDTGTGNAPHLHYELIIDGVAVDAEKAFGKNITDPKVQQDLIRDAYERAGNSDPKSRVFFSRVPLEDRFGIEAPRAISAVTPQEIEGLDLQSTFTTGASDTSAYVAINAPKTELSNKELLKQNGFDFADPADNLGNKGAGQDTKKTYSAIYDA